MEVTDQPSPDAPSLTQAIIVQMVYSASFLLLHVAVKMKHVLTHSMKIAQLNQLPSKLDLQRSSKGQGDVKFYIVPLKLNFANQNTDLACAVWKHPDSFWEDIYCEEAERSWSRTQRWDDKREHN